MKAYLASKSPRRQKLLDQINIDHEVLDIEIDESWHNNETPENYVRRMSLEKARAGLAVRKKRYPVIAADTSVIMEGEVLGKAETSEDVKRMLGLLSGKTHYVLSAVTVIDRNEQTLLNISKVKFREITPDEINTYAASDEPLEKAGGYAIQGQAAIFIKKLEGSFSGVMGLPLFETHQLLFSQKNERPTPQEPGP